MEETIRNKVNESGLIQLDLAKYWGKEKALVYDIANDLWQGLALKEKDFRAKLKETDWSAYQDAYVAVNCSADAIVPTWAFMLITAYLKPYAKQVVFGDVVAANNAIMEDIITHLPADEFQDGRIIVKGCSDINVNESVYITLMNKLQPIAKSIMFGEPCSTVPLYKRK